MYFKMILESGHVGAGNSLETVRYFRADNPVEMFSLAARIPRTKGKARGTGVKLIQPVSREEYLAGSRQEASDPYLNRRKNRKGSRRKSKDVTFH